LLRRIARNLCFAGGHTGAEPLRRDGCGVIMGMTDNLEVKS
jgi:hypothetical protein